MSDSLFLPSYFSSYDLDENEKTIFLIVFLLISVNVDQLREVASLFTHFKKDRRKEESESIVVNSLRQLQQQGLLDFPLKQVQCKAIPLSVQRELFEIPALESFIERIEKWLKNDIYRWYIDKQFVFQSEFHPRPYCLVHRALLKGDIAACETLLRNPGFNDKYQNWEAYARWFAASIAADPTGVPPKVLFYLFPEIAETALATGVNATEISAVLDAHCATLREIEGDQFLAICAWYALTASRAGLRELRGKTQEPAFQTAVDACIALLDGKHDEADKAFAKVLTRATEGRDTCGFHRKRYQNKRLGCNVDRSGNFFCLALLAAIRTGASRTRIKRIIDRLLSYGIRTGTRFAELNNLVNENAVMTTPFQNALESDLAYFVGGLEALFLDDPAVDERLLEACPKLLSRTVANGMGFLASSLVPCVQRLIPNDAEMVALCERVRREAQAVPLWEKSRIVPAWSRALTEIESLLPGVVPEGDDAGSPSQYLVKWLVRLDSENLGPVSIRELHVRLQKRLKSGKWSGGQSLRVDKVFAGEYDSSFDEADLTLKNALFSERSHGYYSTDTFFYQPGAAIAALIGHPRVSVATSSLGYVQADNVLPAKFVKGEASVEVKTTATGSVSVRIPEKSDCFQSAVQIVREKEDRFIVYQRSAIQMKLGEIVRHYGVKGQLVIPVDAFSRFQRLLPALAQEVTVKGEIDIDSVDVRTIDGGVQLFLRGRFLNDMLHLDLLNRPVVDFPLVVTPGMGTSKTLARQGEETVAVVRDLAAERQALDEFLAACPSLSSWAVSGTHWEVEGLRIILDVLDECHALSESIPLEWPEHDAMDIVRPGSGSPFSLQASCGADFWLEIGGDVALNDGQVMAFSELLARAGDRTDGFIRLGERRYLRLTKRLAEQLELLSKAGDSSGDKLRLPPCALPILDLLADESSGLNFPEMVQERIHEFRTALKRRFTLPASLTCELRPYQSEGFVWLAKFAACGLGACLADDMGLGKTVQMLALLTHAADQGPSLVIAPTSVSRNWQDEASRFAPALNVSLLADVENRAELVSQAGPFDVIVCSYGLLLYEEETLISRDWNIIVLDEAQAVKNRLSKRARVVKRLRCAMRTAATGTPVENNLGELWSLFDFLNPGLLGTHSQFERRFCNSDGSVGALLKKMTAPFILRRLKADVLDDLPPKTEVSLSIALDAEERALYESCRRDALTSLKDGGDKASPIVILAHLMRLRRLCCHPSLVLPGCKLPGQKIEYLMELVADLKAAGHRALVFSQFVDFLAIVRARLDQEGITYQYLDGSTPLGQRSAAVKRFQRGEGDLFLISLKAGGTGLNLTAANYVILLDPWWNPAVEMQAADRAHRIGQKNPVTIYRLVTADTVEERVVELHSRKRALADAILEDTGDTKLSAADFVDLFKG